MGGKVKIEMKLLSSTIFSSGEGVGNIIDVDVVYDKYGIPFIPAKRVKGVFREYGEELVLAGIIDEENFYKIFGKSGEIESSLKLSDGYIKNYDVIKEWAAYLIEQDKLTSEYVSRFFTLEISQTAIENGIAKDNSLRTLKALKKNLIFDFDIELDDNLVSDFEKILKVSRHFGLSRSRGFGYVQLKLIKDEEKNSSISKFEVNSDCMKVNIKNYLPLMFYDPTYGNNVSLDYIPGSSLNGFFANLYLKNYGLDEDFYKIFIEGAVRFGNCYKDNSIPAPFSLVRKKDSANEYLNLVDENDIKTIESENIQTKEFPFKFIRISEGEPEGITVFKRAVYHHSRPQDKKVGSPNDTDGEFFQFEVLDKNQEFVGFIEGDSNYLSKLSSLIKDKFYYIGKSKTAQYGKVKISLKEQEISNNKILWKKGEALIFYLFSDAIIYNENGFSSTNKKDFLENVKEKFNLTDISIKSAFINEKIIGGFLSVWKMPKVQKLAMACGSTFVLRNQGKDVEIPSEFFIGARNSEGFGKVYAGKSLKDILKYFEVKDTEKTSNSKNDTPKTSMPSEITQMLAEKVIDEVLVKKIEEYEEKVKSHSDNDDKITNSFIGRLLDIYLESKEIDDLENHIKNMKDKKAGKKIDKIKELLYLDNNSFQKDNFLKIFSSHSNLDIYVEHMIFELYKKYSLIILKTLLYKNKNENNANNNKDSEKGE